MQDDPGSIPALRKSPAGEGNGSPLQYSGLENPMDRGAWWSAAHGVTESGWAADSNCDENASVGALLPSGWGS